MLLSLDGWASTEFRKAGISYPGIRIFSGWRSLKQNESAGGVPDSRHIRCPSQAVDLSLGSSDVPSTQPILAWLGAKWMLLGGRWGGTFRDPSPSHFDLG